MACRSSERACRCRAARLSFAFTIPFALCADVVPEHCAEYEVFFRREQVEGLVDNHTDGIEAFALAEEQVQPVVTDGLYDVSDVLTFQPCSGEVLVFPVEGVEYHSPYAFLVFVYVVHQDLEVCRHDRLLRRAVRIGCRLGHCVRCCFGCVCVTVRT